MRRVAIAAQSAHRLYTPHMLRSLIRLTHVARMLGVDKRTCEAWLRARGWKAARAPVAGRSPASGSPRYVSLDVAMELVNGMLPSKVNRLARARAAMQAGRRARSLEDSTRNMRHAVGGTGLEAPTPKQPL